MIAAVPIAEPTPAGPIARITALMSGLSVEATRPSAADVAGLGVLRRGTRVYLSAVPNRPADELLAAAVQIRAAGLEPVPHVAARNFVSVEALDTFLARLNGEAGVETVLVIAGDRAECGPFRRALDVIDNGVLRRRGIRSIGIAGYPQGHPRVGDDELNRALAGKIAAAEATGLAVEIVTQFCFDAVAILDFVARAQLRLRAPRARRACRADEPHIADALRKPLRRAHLRARTGAPLRPDAADVCTDHAGRFLIRALADAAPAEIVAALFFLRRHSGDRSLGERRRRWPHHA